MSGFDLSKYRAMFQEESAELFDNIDDILLKAETDGALNDEDINSLFRFVHTLKGSSASVELSNFAKFAHQIESFMDKLRDKKLPYLPAMASVLIECIDAMKTLIAIEINDSLTAELYNELTSGHIAAIDAISQTSAPKPIVQTEEYFGFFDDEPIEQNISDDTKSKPYGFTCVADDEGFGFFDNPPDATEPISDDEGYGFFDEPPVPLVLQDKAEEYFGFFDDMVRVKQAELDEKIREEIKEDEQKPQVQLKPKIEKEALADTKTNSSIRVDLSKIDVLMNNVGELVIVNSMLFQLAQEISEASMKSQIQEKLKLLDRHTRELQDSVMSVRMVPMENIYSKFPKTIRDISKKLGKKVEFQHTGDSVEIDKAMIEGLTDPLMHIVRNSLDHGLETPEIRRAKGKPETGTVMINAEQANGQIIISISDDGNGIPADKVALKALENGVIDQARYESMSDDEKVMLIFAPGLSTANEVTDLSGRGVGMDVVKTNINKLGGNISVQTELGIGTTMSIALPLTLAILDGLNVCVGDKGYILPLAVIVESLQPKEEMIGRIGDGEEELLMLREEFIPVVRLHRLFKVEPNFTELTQGMLIVVRAGRQKLALFVDEFLHQQQIVVKSIDKNFRNVKGVGGATVRGDGSIGLILDVLGILEEQKKLEKRKIK